MNVMCDMTQFIIVIPVPNETSATLVDHFMQHAHLKFSICYLIILDDGSPFKIHFSVMYKALNIKFDILAKIIIKVSFIKKKCVSLSTNLSQLQRKIKELMI